MAEWMICPVCGRKFDASEYRCLSNGNPACPDCARNEEDDDDKDEDEEEKNK